MPHPWKHSRWSWTRLWATWSSRRCPCSWQGFGLDGLERSLPTQTVVWFCDSMYVRKDEEYRRYKRQFVERVVSQKRKVVHMDFEGCCIQKHCQKQGFAAESIHAGILGGYRNDANLSFLLVGWRKCYIADSSFEEVKSSKLSGWRIFSTKMEGWCRGQGDFCSLWMSLQSCDVIVQAERIGKAFSVRFNC